MRYRPLGERGPTVSVVGVGGNDFGARLDEEGTKAVVHAALDAAAADWIPSPADLAVPDAIVAPGEPTPFLKPARAQGWTPCER